MNKIIALSFSGLCLLFGMGCFNDLLSDSKKANDMKFITYFEVENECGQIDGSSGYIKFKLDGQDTSIMNCKAYSSGSYWYVWGKCTDKAAVIYLGNGAVGDHKSNLETDCYIEYNILGPDGYVDWWWEGTNRFGGISMITITLHDTNSIKGTFSGTICDWYNQCKTVTDGEFSSVGMFVP